MDTLLAFDGRECGKVVKLVDKFFEEEDRAVKIWEAGRNLLIIVLIVIPVGVYILYILYILEKVKCLRH